MDWTRSMKQTFEFYSVDPLTWKNDSILDKITSATINIDNDSDTVYSASIASSESLGEQYVRIYLVATQDGITDRKALGTFLVQTPSSKFNGKVHDISVDAYSPLLELKEKKPPIGYTIVKVIDEQQITHTVQNHSDLDFTPGHNNLGDISKVLKDETRGNGVSYYKWDVLPNSRGRITWCYIAGSIMSTAYKLCQENMRAPIVLTENSEQLTDNFTADVSEDWLSFLSALVAKANYKLHLDEMGNVVFIPIQNAASLQPRFTYSDDKLSILQPEITIDKDLYGIPNVVEVIYADSTGGYVYSKVTNDDRNSVISTVNRGREVVYRETSPQLPGKPTQEQLDEYAKALLKSLSTIEGTITYKHGFCPVRVGDCVYINYERAGIKDLRAVVKSQSIECKTGCQVSETAVFTENLWG